MPVWRIVIHLYAISGSMGCFIQLDAHIPFIFLSVLELNNQAEGNLSEAILYCGMNELAIIIITGYPGVLVTEKML